MFRRLLRPRKSLLWSASERRALAFPSHLSNAELATQFRNWLVCQRFAHTTRENYNKVVSEFISFWGSKKLTSVTAFDVQSFLLHVSHRDLSADIVHRYLWGLRSFFDFLCLGGIVDECAPRLVRVRNAKRFHPKALSETNVNRLIASASNPRDQALISLYYATGCRASELLNARLEDVDFKNRTIQVIGKGSSRTVLFGDRAARSLREYLGARRVGFLFESRSRIQKGCVCRGKNAWAGYWLD